MNEDDMKQALLDCVRKFVRDQKIYCPETIAQTDRVIENAYDFITDLCNIAGYLEDEDDDE